jgi:hypothetical protein
MTYDKLPDIDVLQDLRFFVGYIDNSHVIGIDIAGHIPSFH